MLKRILQVKQRGGDELADAVRKADQARDAGDHARAAGLYRRVLDRWGPNFGICVQHGNALKDSGSFEDAEHAYFAALQLRPRDADCHLQLGHLMKLAGNEAAALGYYRDAYRLDPFLPDVLREIQRIEEQAFATEHEERPRVVEPPRLPDRMRVDTVDRGDRSRLMRERFTESLRWRRD